jgi:hypothetical protein
MFYEKDTSLLYKHRIRRRHIADWHITGHGGLKFADESLQARHFRPTTTSRFADGSHFCSAREEA